MISSDDIIKIGKFQKTHALKGELNMILDIDPEYFMQGNPLIVEYDGILVPYFAESIRPKGATSYLVKLNGVDNESEASGFVNKEINILKKDIDDWLEEDLILNQQFEGFKIIDANSEMEIGVVESLEDSTANLLFIVKTPDEKELYLPANEDLIIEIDEDNKVIKMKVPEGLLDINS